MDHNSYGFSASRPVFMTKAPPMLLKFGFVLLLYYSTGTNAEPFLFENAIFTLVKQGIGGVINAIRDYSLDPAPASGIQYKVAFGNHHKLHDLDPKDPTFMNRCKSKIFFLFHGWLGSMHFYPNLTKVLIAKYSGACVVQADWNEYSDQEYSKAVFYVKSIGQHFGDFLITLTEKFHIPASKFVLFGFSLGGQVIGFAGKKYREKMGEPVDRLIALDPAGPLFTEKVTKERLTRKDGRVVQIVHTTMNRFGLSGQVGTIDFYPNGGYEQPNCYNFEEIIDRLHKTFFCEHDKSFEDMIDAIENPSKYMARQCWSWEGYQGHRCDNNTQVSMGDLETELKGTFYLTTPT